MQHPFLVEGRPICARQSLASPLSAPCVAATSYCHPGRHAHVVTACLLTPLLNVPKKGFIHFAWVAMAEKLLPITRAADFNKLLKGCPRFLAQRLRNHYQAQQVAAKGRFRARAVLANMPSSQFWNPGEYPNVPSSRFLIREHPPMYPPFWKLPCLTNPRKYSKWSNFHGFSIFLLCR